MTEYRVYSVEVLSEYEAIVNALRAFVPESPGLREARDFQRAVRTIFGDKVDVKIWSEGADRRELSLKG